MVHASGNASGKAQTKGKAIGFGLAVSILLGFMILVGSRRLDHFDAALVGYTFATLFAGFGITYRYAMWLQRPPTRLYWRRGWAAFTHGHVGKNILFLMKRFGTEIVANRFIMNRGLSRWVAHICIMWGCILAVAITFPLVFGWVHFETVPGHLDTYRAYVFGFPTSSFPIESFIGFMTFHALVWASILVVIGVMIAMRRRMRDHGAASLQQFAEDFLPLILLFAISVTGLMLTASYTWMKGYAYDFIAILHAITVIFTLLWLPFGKFFHLFQRPAQLGVTFYKDTGREGEQAKCRRCGQEYASKMMVEDLIEVETELGFDYAAEDPEVGHYQRICPRCRRAMFGLAQGKLWSLSSADDLATGKV